MVALLKMPTAEETKPTRTTETRPVMRLVPDDRYHAKLGTERRLFPRKPTHTQAEARRVDHSIDAQRNPRLSLTLRDLSIGGMSASCEAPLLIGERLCVFFPPSGTRRGWHVLGRVMRCEPSGMGYRVAVEFDRIPSAA